MPPTNKNSRDSLPSIYEEASQLLSCKELEELLFTKLKGLSLHGLPIRTRSKLGKQAICEALGCQIPKSFQKTTPRFPIQQFESYFQKSLNLQIWNTDISHNIRYAIIHINEDDIVDNVKVILGKELMLLDTTGTLTQKYQAKLKKNISGAVLISVQDTKSLLPLTSPSPKLCVSPCLPPKNKSILNIEILFEKLKNIIGTELPILGAIQERNRGALLHEKVCSILGYDTYQDNGQFPDIPNQLLEIKLQTSPTIDLGQKLPSDDKFIDIEGDLKNKVQICDVRYAIFYGDVDKTKIKINDFALVTGQDFFEHFTRFEGNITNKKIQIPLSSNFFS